MYKPLRKLLKSGFEVSFTPLKSGEVVLAVQEARNGTVKAVEVKLNPFEWSLVEKGLSERLEEAISHLIP